MPVLERVPMQQKKLYGPEGAPIIYGYRDEKPPWFEEEPFCKNELISYLEYELLRRGICERSSDHSGMDGLRARWRRRRPPHGETPRAGGKLFPRRYRGDRMEQSLASCRGAGNACDRLFLGNALSLFALHEHHAPPERPYVESWFHSRWRTFPPTDAPFNSIGNLRLSRIKPYSPVPPEAQAPDYQRALEEVTEIVPETLKVAVKNIRSTYHW